MSRISQSAAPYRLRLGTCILLALAMMWGATVTALAQSAQPLAPAASTATADAPTVPTKVKAGMFITQLYDLDVPRKSFNISFWAWFLHSDDKYKPLESVEIVNSKASAVKNQSVTETSGLHWAQGKYSAMVAQEWDVEKFPFDRQILKVYLEDAVTDASSVVFIADSENSRIDKSVDVPGWDIESFDVKAVNTVYDTTYGDPSLQGQSTYSRIVASITMKREGTRLLCSMFIGFFVAFILTCFTYFLDVDMMAGARISLCAGAIFASAGNKIAVDNILAPSSSFTLADGIEASTFIIILVAINMVIAQRWLKDSHPVTGKWLNRVCATMAISSYLLFNGYMIWKATI